MLQFRNLCVFTDYILKITSISYRGQWVNFLSHNSYLFPRVFQSCPHCSPRVAIRTRNTVIFGIISGLWQYWRWWIWRLGCTWLIIRARLFCTWPIIRARFLSPAQSKLRLCSANHRAGYLSNLTCDWLSIVWALDRKWSRSGDIHYTWWMISVYHIKNNNIRTPVFWGYPPPPKYTPPFNFIEEGGIIITDYIDPPTYIVVIFLHITHELWDVIHECKLIKVLSL